MKVKLLKGRPALPADIRLLENEIGSSLPAVFLEFLKSNDGAEPETNGFKVAMKNESGVNGFIPVREIPSERANIENLPSTAFPIAWAEGGNYVCIDAASGVVYFWDHEQPSLPVPLAQDFADFLNLLEAFDPSSVKLKPGQVKSAWIDPDFLKSIGQ
jgi:hypothetical protein